MGRRPEGKLDAGVEYGGAKTKINPLVVWARLSATLRQQISLGVAIIMGELGT